MTKPQYAHLSNYTLGLMMPSEKNRKTMVAITESTRSPRHSSNLDRFLTRSHWDEESLNEERIREETVGTEGWIVIDDTLIRRWGPKVEGAGSFWDHTENRSKWSHSVFTSVWAMEDRSVPLRPDIYLKEKDAARLGRPFRTKIDMACEEVHRRAGMDGAQGVVFDTWYAATDLMKTVRKSGLHWYTNLRSDRKAWTPRGGWCKLKDLVGRIEEDEFLLRKDTTVLPSYTRAAMIDVQLKKVGWSRLFILLDKQGHRYFLCTSDRKANLKGMMRAWAARWSIEEFHREAKQHLGLGESQTTQIIGVVRHLRLVCLAYSLLDRLRRRGAQPADLVFSSLGEAARTLKQAMSSWLERRGPYMEELAMKRARRLSST